MIELTNPELRARDIRKLVQPSLYQVSWDVGFEDGNEWICMNSAKNAYWIKSKNIDETSMVICIDEFSTKINKMTYKDLTVKFDELVQEGFSLFVSKNRDWVLQCNCSVGVARFGYWT
jgi:hypothetical protein